MSVLIKGMKMPKNCGECQFCHTEFFTEWCCPTGREDVSYDSVPQWCPLEDPAKWTPASEKSPEIDMGHPHHEDYLVQYDSGDMDVASWSNVNRFWTDRVTEPYWNCVQFANVVAWMPLPKPWKGEENERPNQ